MIDIRLVIAIGILSALIPIHSATATPSRIDPSYSSFTVIAKSSIGSPTINRKVEKAQDIIKGKKNEGSPVSVRTAKALASKANGQCLPYARNATGIKVYGAAKNAPELAKKAGYKVTKEPIDEKGMLITNESIHGHAAVYEVQEDGMIKINEQNYLGNYVVSERVLSPKDPSIVAFISS